MKHQILLGFALFAAVLLWPGCDDEVVPPSCSLNVPTVPFSDGSCEPVPLYLNDLANNQEGSFPTLPIDCVPGTKSRIVRLNPSSDGELFLHLYVGIPAEITYQVFGADCEENISALTSCLTSKAIAISEPINDGSDFEDVYVYISYELFTTPRYDNYTLAPSNFIAVASYDNLPEPPPNRPGISYNRGGEGPEFIDFSCDDRFFQRLIITACNSAADVRNWGEELGLPLSEECVGDGATVLALDVPAGMNPNAIGGEGALGGADKPLTNPRRPKQDSTDFIVEPDYAITVSSFGNGLYQSDEDCSSNGQFGIEDLCFKPSPEVFECLRFEPGKGSTQSGGDVVMVTMIDSGVATESVWSSLWAQYLYRNGPENKFLVNGSLGYDFIRGDSTPDDEIGHGTATGGTVIGGYNGEAPLTVVHNKIFGSQNLATYYGALLAINSAIDTESDIINMSWGIIQDNPPIALECAMRRADSKGIIVITSAGNENAPLDMIPQWPAAFSEASYKLDNMLTVGSMTYPDFDISEDPVKTFFSSFSSNLVDVSAYLTSASPDRNGASQDEVVFIAGTSISAPMVTRSVAGFVGANNNGDLEDWRGAFLRRSIPLRDNNQVVDGNYLPICAEFE
ncbi:S8 family peptidase [Neolewinella persica]|uniref:S8 family peptidase n=1 Tax=Neolewinella persica TaxID=70998 RepID=UPI00036D41D1|nr:S8 family serine peptidase [Neolewinella persica]